MQRKIEESESGTRMTEFESDNSESHDTDFAISSFLPGRGQLRLRAEAEAYETRHQITTAAMIGFEEDPVVQESRSPGRSCALK